MSQQPQKRDQQEPGPRPPPPAPPRPKPLPPPPQPPQPPTPPTPPAATYAQVARAHSHLRYSEQKLKCILDVDPETGERGKLPTISGSSNSDSMASVGVSDTNTEGKEQYQDMCRQQVTSHDDAAIKRIRENDKPQQATEVQGKIMSATMNVPPFVNNDFDPNGLVGFMLRSSCKKPSGDSQPTSNTKIEDSAASTIPKVQDYQNGHSYNGEVRPETDSSDDDSIEGYATDDLFYCVNYEPSLYVDAKGKLYRRLQGVKMFGILRECVETKEKCEDTGRPGTVPPAASVQSPHSGVLSPVAAIDPPGPVLPLPPVRGFVLQEEPITMKTANAQQKYPDVRAKTSYNSKLNSSASKHLDGTLAQVREVHHSHSLPKGTEQQLPGRLPQQQRETSDNALATGRDLQVVSNNFPLQTTIARASAAAPQGDADGKRDEQCKVGSVVTEKLHRKLENMKLNAITQARVQPEEKLRNTGIFATDTSAGSAKSPHSVIPTPPAGGRATGSIHPGSDGQDAAKQPGESTALKVTTAQRDCAAISVPQQCTLNRGSFTPENPGATESQSSATQRAVTPPREGHLTQQQRETSNVLSTAAPVGQGVSNHVASQTQRPITCTPPAFGNVGGIGNVQPGTTYGNMQHRNPELQFCPQNQQLNQNYMLPPMGLVPELQPWHQNQQLPPNNMWPPMGLVPEQQVSYQNSQMQHNYMMPPMGLVPVQQNVVVVGVPYIVTHYAPVPPGGIGYNVNQQPVAGAVHIQNPPAGNLTAATLQERQYVPASLGTPGNSKKENGGNSNNQKGSTLNVYSKPFVPGVGYWSPEPSNSQPTGQRELGGGSEASRQPGSAPEASC